MRLSEITKKDFLQKLKNPIQFRIKNSVKKLQDILDKDKEFKMSKIDYINHRGRDIIKFTISSPKSHKIDYSDGVRTLEWIVFDSFRDIIEPKMSDAIHVEIGDHSKITFIYYLKK